MQETTTEGPPSLIKLNVDNKSKARVFCHWVVFLVIIIIIFICTTQLPNATQETNGLPLSTLDECLRVYGNDERLAQMCFPLELVNNPVFGGRLGPLSNKNQYVMVMLYFLKQEHLKKVSLEMEMSYNYDLYAVGDNLKIQDTIAFNRSHTTKIKCPAGQQLCERQWIIYENQITHSEYVFRVEILTKQSDPNLVLSLREYGVTFYYMNEKYTEYLLALRYTCLAVSVIAIFLYEWALHSVSKQHLVIEQKFVRALSIFLFFFNDPIYALTVLVPNHVSAFFSVMFVVTFVIALLLFWLVMLQRIVIENGQKKSKAFDKKKVIFGFVLWLLLLLTYFEFSRLHIDNPSTTFYGRFTAFFDFCKYASIVLLCLYWIVIIGWYVRCFLNGTYSSRLWRHKVFLTFSIYFIVCMAVFMFFGSADVYNNYGTRVLLFITMANLYIYYMQFMYTPSLDGILEAQQMRQIEYTDSNKAYEELDNHAIDLNLADNSNAPKPTPNDALGARQNYARETPLEVAQDELIIGRPAPGKNYAKQRPQAQNNGQEQAPEVVIVDHAAPRIVEEDQNDGGVENAYEDL